MAKQTNSLAHTKWMCKYHIVFTPKYRRKIVYNQYKSDLRDILKQLCSYKGVEILEGHLMPDHVHMLVSIPPKISVSSFMGYLKGKSALMMFDRHANLKYKFGNRHFWSEDKRHAVRYGSIPLFVTSKPYTAAGSDGHAYPSAPPCVRQGFKTVLRNLSPSRCTFSAA